MTIALCKKFKQKITIVLCTVNEMILQMHYIKVYPTSNSKAPLFSSMGNRDATSMSVADLREQW